MSRVVMYWMKGHDMFGCCMSMGWWKYNWLYDEYVIGSGLPFLLFVVCSVVWLFFCDDHQFDWWEQMDEILVASKEMEISLPSPRGLDYGFLWTLLWAMAPVFRCSWICNFLVKSLSCFGWHCGVPSFVGVVLRTPGLRCCTILCVAFPLIAVLN